MVEAGAKGVAKMHRRGVLMAAVALVALVGLAAAAEAGSVSGTVTDSAGGQGINKALVVLVSGTTPVAAGRSASNGHYELAGVANAAYTIVVSANNYAPKADNVTVNGDLTLNVPLRKLTGPDYKSLGRIVGFVKSTANKPVANALLLLVRGNAVVGASQPENATGVYELQWYTPGTYTVIGVAPGHKTATYPGQVIAAGESLMLEVALEPK